MDTFGGMTPTERRISAPIADLQELVSDRGLRHIALVFGAPWRSRGELRSGLQSRLGFMEDPRVNGLAPLVFHHPSEGLFAYATGAAWAVSEVLAVFAGLGKAVGTRAGLELMFQAGQILLEAAAVGAEEGVDSHGSLSPWRIFLRADGQVRIVGYGLPQPELLKYREDPAAFPGEEAFRFAPPERLEGGREDFTSDLVALALVVFEVITGKRVYEGSAKDIEQQATRGEGQRRLYQMRSALHPEVRELLARCLKYDPDSRFQDGDDFVYTVKNLLTAPDLDGPSLVDVMRTVSATVGTGTYTPPAAPAPEVAAPAEPEPVPRYGGRARRTEPEVVAEAPRAPAAEDARAQLRRGLAVSHTREEDGARPSRRGPAEDPMDRPRRSDTGRAELAALRRAAPEDPAGPARRLRPEEAEDRLAARLGRRARSEPEEEETNARRRPREEDPLLRRPTRRAPEEPDESTLSAADRLRRRTRSATESEAPLPPPPVEAPVAGDAEPVRRRRRRSGGIEPNLSTWRVTVDGGAEATLDVRTRDTRAAWLMAVTEALGGRPMGLDGRLHGWMRGPEGAGLPGADDLHALTTVPARWIRLRLRSALGDLGIPVWSALRIGEVMVALDTWFPEPVRRMVWQGRELDAALVMGELTEGAELQMVVEF